MNNIDIAVIGGGINGSSTALHLAKSGLKVCVIDKDSICRGASGVNAGTLTMHMTRAKLIPCAKKGWELWMNTEKWLSNNIDVKKKQPPSIAVNLVMKLAVPLAVINPPPDPPEPPIPNP